MYINNMVNYPSKQLSTTFAALSDPTRRAILERLGTRTCTVSELAAPFSISLPAISKHISVLESAGLIRRERQGREQHCHLNAGAMQAATEWLERYRAFWEQQLDALAEHLENQNSS